MAEGSELELEDTERLWSMESGDEDGDLPDTIIETVARANTVNVGHAPQAPVLPEIRAAPCPIHFKQYHGRNWPEEIKDSSSGQSKYIKSNKKDRQMHPIKSITIQQNTSSQDNVKRNINVRIPEQFPMTAKAPVLPKNMSSKDYVLTWLIHGSEPQGSNHFPEIIPNQTKTRPKAKQTPRKTFTDHE